MGKPRPGVDIFSREWFNEHATAVPEQLMDSIKLICSGYHLGDTRDPNDISEIILRGMASTVNCIHVLDGGASELRIKPVGIVFRKLDDGAIVPKFIGTLMGKEFEYASGEITRVEDCDGHWD